MNLMDISSLNEINPTILAGITDKKFYRRSCRLIITLTMKWTDLVTKENIFYNATQTTRVTTLFNLYGSKTVT